MTEYYLHDETVLIRTEIGQHAVFDDLDLDATSQRLLRLVNGYTPFAVLIGRLDRHFDWHQTARSLLERRLVGIRVQSLNVETDSTNS